MPCSNRHSLRNVRHRSFAPSTKHHACEMHHADFLPFVCDACTKVLCLEHRSYTAHACTKAAGRDHRVIACPICLQRVGVSADEDVNVTFERHMATSGCDPAKRSQDGRRQAQQQCGAAKCRTKLGPSNRFECKSCSKVVCLSHRLPESHQCGVGATPGAAKPTTGLLSGLNGLLGGRPNAESRAASARAAASRAAAARRTEAGAKPERRGPTPRKPATSTRAGTRMPPGEMTRSLREASAARYGARVSSASAREVCPHCGARFGEVEALVSHVTSAHAEPAPMAPTRAASGVGRGDACPRCGQSFSDVLALIAHCESGACAVLPGAEVRRWHPVAATASSSGGTRASDCCMM